MGQKVHPGGMRVGVIHDWKSNWYTGKREFSDYILEDIKIREHIYGKLSHAGLSDILIRKDKQRVTVDIYTARPGIVIGKSGVEVDALRRELHAITKKNVHININEIKRPELDAKLVAQSIAEQLENRVSFRRAMKRALASGIRSGAQGIRIMCGGRLGGTEMSRSESYSEGKVPLHTIHADLLTNDFNQVFRNVAETYAGTPGGPIYCSAVGGSFFEQILPSRSVHFGMCSNAAHWFRVQPQVDVPEGMYFSDACGAAREKLARQAADDWLAFLRARASEIVPGGRMLVQGIATVHDADGSEKVSAAALLQLMWQIANTMVEDSLLDCAILGRYLFPVYCRSKEEATAPVNIGGLLARDFGIVSAEISETGNPYWEQFEQSGDPAGYARSYTAFVRAFAESTLMKNLFASSGKSSELCDEFFSRFESAIRQDPSRGKYEAWVLRLILARR